MVFTTIDDVHDHLVNTKYDITILRLADTPSTYIMPLLNFYHKTQTRFEYIECSSPSILTFYQVNLLIDTPHLLTYKQCSTNWWYPAYHISEQATIESMIEYMISSLS